jgi:hypothetical protein
MSRDSCVCAAGSHGHVMSYGCLLCLHGHAAVADMHVGCAAYGVEP